LLIVLQTVIPYWKDNIVNKIILASQRLDLKKSTDSSNTHNCQFSTDKKVEAVKNFLIAKIFPHVKTCTEHVIKMHLAIFYFSGKNTRG
jgi:hypothetical protein